MDRPATVTLACHAMATRFEILLHGRDAVALRAAGEEVLAEIERLENQLSLFRPASEIAHLNARAAREPVRVTPGLFRLLQQAENLWRETGGAFDITIGALVQCWGFREGSGYLPDPRALADALPKTGMHQVQLDPATLSVRFAREGVSLNLGAIGKGYAIERAAEILREAGVESALLHGGTSTVYALGGPPDAEAWTVAIEDSTAPGEAQRPVLATVLLRDEAMSVSAIWGRSFEAEGKTYGHVIDPHSGLPVAEAVLAAVVLPSATETDALSTALLVLGHSGHARLAEIRPAMRTFLAIRSGERFSFEHHGIPPHAK